jgi:hypothetical protein
MRVSDSNSAVNEENLPDTWELSAGEWEWCVEEARKNLKSQHPKELMLKAVWREFSLSELPEECGPDFQGVPRSELIVITKRGCGERYVFTKRTIRNTVLRDCDAYCESRLFFDEDGFIGRLLPDVAPELTMEEANNDRSEYHLLRHKWEEELEDVAERIAEKYIAEKEVEDRELEKARTAKEAWEKHGTPIPPGVATIETVPPNHDLESLTYCDGLVGEIVDWICDTALRPNRVLALGAAISVIGTLLGRRVAGPTRSGTHLYVLGLARTAHGKQHPLDCAKDLLNAAGAPQLIGPGRFTTGPAVSDHLEENPLSLCCQDEFGSFLNGINKPSASRWEADISLMMRELWGLSFKRYDGMRWAKRKPNPIHAPAFSIFGMSTPEQFYESLKSGDLPNGFVNRFLLLYSDKKYPEQDPKLEPGVPDDIKKSLKALYEWRGNPYSAVDATRKEHIPVPDVRPWANSEAKETYSRLRSHIQYIIDGNEAKENFWGRTAEMAVRLATIRAAGRNIGNYDFDVNTSDIEWGRELAWRAASKLSKDAGSMMTAATLNRAELHTKIINVLKAKKGRLVSRRDVLRALPTSTEKRVFDDVIAMAKGRGEIEEYEEKPGPKGGRTSVLYRLIGE